MANISAQYLRFNGRDWTKIKIQDHLFTLKLMWCTTGDVLEDVQAAFFNSVKAYSDQGHTVTVN